MRINRMEIYDFTEPELEFFRSKCNFTPEEKEYFELRAKDKKNYQIAMEMCVSESKVYSLSKRVKRKMKRVI